MARLVRALTYGVEGPRMAICKSQKYHVMTDWLHVLCAWARPVTLIRSTPPR